MQDAAAASGGFTGTVGLSSVQPSERPQFLVASMYTPSHRALAERLAASLSSLGLPFSLFLVPAVHRSITPRGTADTRYTKASLIRYLLDTHKVPILYLDCDCVVRAAPRLMSSLIESGIEFAIYNWLADEYNDAYLPVRMLGDDGKTIEPALRFFRFSHGEDSYSTAQLICSGATQWYADTAAARELLSEWSAVIDAHPGVPDDHCLDSAFNLRLANERKPKAAWLPKRYARYLFWIFTRPIIDHPQFPTQSEPVPSYVALSETQRLKPDLIEVHPDARLVPRDCILDLQLKRLLALRPVPSDPTRMVTSDIGPLLHAIYL